MNDMKTAVEEKTPDLLGRQACVDRLMMIVEASARRRRSLCFAINGGWGVGKSFVLDMFEEQAGAASEGDDDQSAYLILRYNCWEYDYYDEPLVAIVAAMLDELEEKFPPKRYDTKAGFLAALKEVGSRLVKSLAQTATTFTGLPITDAVEVVGEAVRASRDAATVDHDFDDRYLFKRILREFQGLIASLAAEQPVIFIVDELDRCLPQYTIRVLERIHHLLYGLENVQVIFSIDKEQLDHAVRQIYGSETDAEQYLRKFITFELKLTPGSVRGQFDRRFRSYVSCFAALWPQTAADEAEEFRTMILEGLDMRMRVALVEKCELIHGMLAEDAASDLSMLCLELLLAVLYDCGVDTQWAKQHFTIGGVFAPENLWPDGQQRCVPQGLVLLSELYKRRPKLSSRLRATTDTSLNKAYVDTGSLYGMLLAVYRLIIGWEDDAWINGDETQMRILSEHGKRMWGLLESIN